MPQGEKIPIASPPVTSTWTVARPPESAYSKSKHFQGKSVALAGMLGMLLLCPPISICMWFILTQMQGSVSEFIIFCHNAGLSGLWNSCPRLTAAAWQLIGTFAAFEAILLVAVPGPVWIGPVSPAGNRPIYWRNGFRCYVITLLTYFIIARLGLFDFTVVYDHMGEITLALQAASTLLCLFLYIKGNIAPSSSDWGSSGNFIQDFFWGMELYPRIGKYFDIKTFTNCRLGMMSWAVLVITYVLKQQQLYGQAADSMLVAAALMLLYVSKFFLWEAGYWSSMDIQHDRAGYYLCWGCMVWVPCVYTSPALYLVHHPIHLGTPLATVIFLLGATCILINYDADRQRIMFRSADGNCLVWGRPAVKIEAWYTTEKGELKQSLLLASGWWGIARHFHYVPEILASLLWTIPGGFQNGIQYFYLIYLTMLLMHRAIRDDQRCRNKYGKYWDEYCERVPYKVVPLLY